MKYTNELIEDARAYLRKKTGSTVSDDVVDAFVKQLSEMGELFKNNAAYLRNDS